MIAVKVEWQPWLYQWQRRSSSGRPGSWWKLKCHPLLLIPLRVRRTSHCGCENRNSDRGNFLTKPKPTQKETCDYCRPQWDSYFRTNPRGIIKVYTSYSTESSQSICLLVFPGISSWNMAWMHVYVCVCVCVCVGEHTETSTCTHTNTHAPGIQKHSPHDPYPGEKVKDKSDVYLYWHNVYVKSQLSQPGIPGRRAFSFFHPNGRQFAGGNQVAFGLQTGSVQCCCQNEQKIGVHVVNRTPMHPWIQLVEHPKS
jgi:hypothetical protein